MRRIALRGGRRFALAQVPVLSAAEARASILAERDAGRRLVAFFGLEDPASSALRCMVVTANDSGGLLHLTSFEASGAEPSYPSLTLDWLEANLFEREIAEQYGIRPIGHPWLKPVRGERPLVGRELFPAPPGARSRLDAYPFLRASGEEMHEVGVGPVHAGIIEPGHFRFLCHGEQVHHLEISLGYQHRGVERRFLGGPDKRSLVLAESIAGDCVIGHALTYCRAIERLAEARVSARALALRSIALEIERCANHVGDLGALANDVGYLPGAAWFGRLRGEFLNMLMDLSGNRYGRGFLLPGGVAFDVGPQMAADFVARLRQAERDFGGFSDLLFEKPSVMARFEHTGALDRAQAEELGLVGPVARATGCERDVRHDFPFGAYRFAHIPVATAQTGDVEGRALVRRIETERSIEFLIEWLQSLPQGALRVEVGPLAPQSGCVVLTEGWRGEIAHVAITDRHGRFARYKVVDPSFHNWAGLALALRGQEISDFPLCNKSFNLSYAGHDL